MEVTLLFYGGKINFINDTCFGPSRDSTPDNCTSVTRHGAIRAKHEWTSEIHSQHKHNPDWRDLDAWLGVRSLFMRHSHQGLRSHDQIQQRRPARPSTRMHVNTSTINDTCTLSFQTSHQNSLYWLRLAVCAGTPPTLVHHVGFELWRQRGPRKRHYIRSDFWRLAITIGANLSYLFLPGWRCSSTTCHLEENLHWGHTSQAWSRYPFNYLGGILPSPTTDSSAYRVG